MDVTHTQPAQTADDWAHIGDLQSRELGGEKLVDFAEHADTELSCGSASGSPVDELDALDWLDWFNSLSPSRQLRDRDHLLVSGLKAGHTLQVMGDLYQLSRERVRQIAAVRGVNSTDLRRQAKERARRIQRRLERRIYGTSLTHPELDISEVADMWDTDDATVRAALGHRVAVHEPRSYGGEAQRVGDDVLLTALKRWSDQTSTLTSNDYDVWSRREGVPGKQTAINRFGGWNAALALAGIPAEKIDNRGGLRPQISEDAIWASLVEFYVEDRPAYSAAAYDTFARDHGLASLATIRVRLGQWSELHSTVRSLLRYAANPDGSSEFCERVLAIIPSEEPRGMVSAEECLQSLVHAADTFEGPVTVLAYEAARRPEDPQASMIQMRLGSWIDALVAADLTQRMSGKARMKLARRELEASAGV